MKGNEFEYFLDNLSLSTLLAKFSFAFLLLSMLFYWFQASFKYNRETFLGKIPSLAMWLANIALALMLSIRWVESGHFPLSNLYESLLFLSWSLTSIHFFLERAFYHGGIISPTLGAITAPLALFTNAFATFSLPEEMQKVSVLVPALQSNWLIMHVSVMMVSYAALLSGSLLAMAYLVVKFVEDTLHSSRSEMNDLIKQGLQDSLFKYSQTFSFFLESSLANQKLGTSSTSWNDQKDPQFKPLENTFSKSSIPLQAALSSLDGATSMEPKAPWASKLFNVPQDEQSQLALELKIPREKKLKQTLDNLSYRAIGLGFALLTIGIFSGAVWANEAWGSYWSWDPKETWAFITWLVFAFYLHTRLSRGWVGKESAFVATFGFLIIWFCYLGVNLFGKGLHSYGWFATK